MPQFPAIAHVALTVSDLGRSVPWYERVFGASPVLDQDRGPFRHVVWALGQTLFGLHEHSGRPSSEPFSEFRPGLDHVSFACANLAELEEWRARLDEFGIDHGGVIRASYGSGLSFRDPDDFALEFFTPPG